MPEQKLNLYVIAGCNGAGKTTASFTVLPEMLDCREFVNADEIAAGLSPFNPEGVAIEAGRLMINRILHLLKEGETFAFETTLATRSYVKLIQQAQKRGYFVTLLFFSLSSPEQACKRVAKRVSEGGHNIPTDVIYRRYEKCPHHTSFQSLHAGMRLLDTVRQQYLSGRENSIRLEKSKSNYFGTRCI